MSIQAITAAMALRGVPPSEKLLLIGLANYADEGFQCFPSQRKLAEDTGLSERQVRRIALGLENRGMITRTERRRPDGSRSSDMIKLTCLQPDTMSGGVGTPCPGGGDTMSGHNQSYNHLGSKEPKIRARDGFDRFWQAYPHKVGKQAAQKAWNAAKTLPDVDAVLSAIDAYKLAKPPDRPWCNPATWINQGRWSDVHGDDKPKRVGWV